MAQTMHLALFGPFLSLLAFVGRHWLLCNKNKIKNLYIKNIMYLVWPKQCVWRRLGPFSSLLAFVGHHWLLWAFVGLRWPLLAAVGLRWPSLTCVGLC